MSQRHSVVIFAGPPSPPEKLVKAVGPFPSRDDAEARIMNNGYDPRPGADEWGVVLPSEEPER
jgi:hypothetical protein